MKPAVFGEGFGWRGTFTGERCWGALAGGLVRQLCLVLAARGGTERPAAASKVDGGVCAEAASVTYYLARSSEHALGWFVRTLLGRRGIGHPSSATDDIPAPQV